MEDVFAKLKEQLEQQEWPGVFLFKFIVPNSPELLAKTTALFGSEAEISLQPSRNDKYISVSVKELMLNAESIIEKYKKVSEIKGLIAL